MVICVKCLGEGSKRKQSLSMYLQNMCYSCQGSNTEEDDLNNSECLHFLCGVRFVNSHEKYYELFRDLATDKSIYK